MSDLAALPEPLERIVLAAQQASPTVRLVGGSGLAWLLGHRRSDDLDLFGAVREDNKNRAYRCSVGYGGTSRHGTYVGAIRVESLRDQRANKIVALLGRLKAARPFAGEPSGGTDDLAYRANLR